MNAPSSAVPLLEARGLVKSYGDRRVVDGVDVCARKGAVLGLLGPNGAGKTTTLRMLYGLVEAEAGEIRYQGRCFRRHRSEIKRFIGVCPQEDTLDYDLTVRQNLSVYAGYFRPRVEGVERRTDELLERFGLAQYATHTPHQLSGGFKRRLLIARSVVHSPGVLYLDEPTTGLDPKARVDLWELVHALRREGMAIVLTTHYMDEAERLSDDLLVLSNGRDMAHGRTAQVISDTLGEHVVVIAADAPQREPILEWLHEHLRTRPAAVLGELRVPVSTEQLAQFSERFRDARFGVRQPNLDDLFLELSAEPPTEGPS